MDCRRARRLSSEAVDGRLAARARRALRGHLEGCPECRAAMRDFERMKAVLAGSEPRPAGPEFWEQALVRARVQHDAARRAALNGLLRWQRGAAWATAAAAVALLLAVPLRLPEWQQDRAGDARNVIAWHAGYCARRSLADRAPMQLLATRAHLSGSR